MHTPKSRSPKTTDNPGLASSSGFCYLRGPCIFASVGLEANPVVHLAARVKTSWDVAPHALVDHAESVAEAACETLRKEGVDDDPFFQPLRVIDPASLRTLDSERERLLIKHSISPLPLHKVLVLLEHLEEQHDERFYDHERVALAKQLVYSISNLRFGPEVGVGKAKKNPPVVKPWLAGVKAMAEDLRHVRRYQHVPSRVYLADARQVGQKLKAHMVDAVITSPPYPNEKDYTRTTRLESVLLGFMQDRKDLRRHKYRLLRSNTRGVYKKDTDDQWIAAYPRIQELADTIEERRIELGKTSGFEKMYARVVRLYFGGMVRHLEELKHVLKPGAPLAYVVGDQASYFRIMIRTGELLAEIAAHLGYEVVDIELFRERFSTATQADLREEVVLLRWKGSQGP